MTRRTFSQVLVLHLGSSLQTPGIQDDTLLVMREHIACGETLQEAVVIAAIPFADLAVHLHKTPLHLLHRSWHCAVCRLYKFWGAEQVAAVCQLCTQLCS